LSLNDDKIAELEQVKNLIFQMANLKNQLQELGIIKNSDNVLSGYAEWFCSVKFGLELCNKNEIGYDALSNFEKRILIKSKVGSDINFEIDFEIRLDNFDYLFIVFIDENTWMIDSVYSVSFDIVTKFLNTDLGKKFEWRRESRSLSLQLYPSEENTLEPVF
jgi:hypothetical protein